MSWEYVLFHIGKALPTIALFAAVSAVGYKIRETKGLAVATGILAGVLGFGILTQAFGESQMQEKATIALGAVSVSTAVAFVLVYKVLQFLRKDSNDYGRAVVLIGMVASAVTGTLIAVCGATLMVGLPVFNASVDTLIWSSLLLIGLAGVISEYRAVSRKDADAAAKNPENITREPARYEAPGESRSKWHITKR